MHLEEIHISDFNVAEEEKEDEVVRVAEKRGGGEHVRIEQRSETTRPSRRRFSY